jgi:D-alanyl-lipoteichoic acid acyltransferase DltB (MBOAT superfamily)
VPRTSRPVVQLSLLSPGFLGLALIAVLVLPVLHGRARQVAFITINLAFLSMVLLGPASTITVMLFALVGYALALAAAGQRRDRLVVALVLCVGLFVWLQRYDFLQLLLPEAAFPRFVTTIGLSFLFFKIVHVIVDSYSGTLGPLDPVTYLNYCLNFATFAMVPIQRFQDYRAQWEGIEPALPDRFEPHLDAVVRILLGMVKVYVLAPWFEQFAAPIPTCSTST